MQFITDLCESKLLPSYLHIKHYESDDIAEFIYFYFCAINILANEDETKHWVAEYCRRTLLYGNFAQKRNSATDLYVLIYALLHDEHVKKEKHGVRIDHISIDLETMVTYLKNVAHRRLNRPTTQRLFLNMDRRLHIADSSLRALRRLAMNWDRLEEYDKKLCLTRLLQVVRHRTKRRSELLPFLEQIARHQHLELQDVVNRAAPKRSNLLKSLDETSSAGGTGSASVATVVGGTLGAGFDPNGDWGIYQSRKPKKTREKFGIIRRVAPL